MPRVIFLAERLSLPSCLLRFLLRDFDVAEIVLPIAILSAKRLEVEEETSLIGRRWEKTFGSVSVAASVMDEQRFSNHVEDTTIGSSVFSQPLFNFSVIQRSQVSSKERLRVVFVELE